MAGRKGRSGPPGNTNAMKEENSYKLLLRGEEHLLPQDAWVKKPIKDRTRAFFADLPDTTAREREVIHTIGVALGIELLITKALQKCGLVSVRDGQVQVAKASEDLARFMKIKLDALRLLPATRRAKVVASLSEYLKSTNGALEAKRQKDHDTQPSQPQEG